MKVILGDPRIKGNSTAIQSCLFTGVVGEGLAVSGSTSTAEQKKVKAFDGDSFVGVLSALDIDKDVNSCSVVRTGIDIPVIAAAGKSWAEGVGIGLNASGALVPAGDDDEVYAVNGAVNRVSVTGIDSTGAEVADCITIDLFGGGGAATGA